MWASTKEAMVCVAVTTNVVKVALRDVGKYQGSSGVRSSNNERY